MGYCFRCGFPWEAAKPHVTSYNETTGCFPLCEGCWTELGCAEARIEYYGMLVDHWASSGWPITEDARAEIGRAVANGG